MYSPRRKSPSLSLIYEEGEKEDEDDIRPVLTYFLFHLSTTNYTSRLYEKQSTNSNKIKLVDISQDHYDQLDYISLLVMKNNIVSHHHTPGNRVLAKFINFVEQTLNLTTINISISTSSIQIDLSNAYCDEEININSIGEHTEFSIYPPIPVKRLTYNLYSSLLRGPRSDDIEYTDGMNTFIPPSF